MKNEMLVIEPSTSKFLTHFQIMMRIGSLSDPESHSGLAHFTARALLRGTRTKSFQELSLAIEILGGSISVNVDQSETMFRASVLTQNLEPFLDLIQEILTEPRFDGDEFEMLKKILEGELEQSLQDPRALVSRALLQTAYVGTGLARPSEGTLQGLEKIELGDLKKFFTEHYSRSNLLFGITGATPENELRTLVTERLNTLPSGKRTEQGFPVSVFQNRKTVLIERDEMSTVPLFFAIPGVSDSDPEMLALEVGNFIFGDDFTARLMQVLRNQNGWTYGAYSGFAQLLGPKKQAGLFSVYLFPSAEFVEKAAPKTLELLENYAQNGLNEQEFEFAREALFSRYPFRLDSPEKRLTLKLREIVTGRKFLQPSEYRKQLSCLERKQVNDTIAKRTSTRNMIVSAAGDVSKLEPVFAGLSGFEGVQKIEL
jgi:zinc protease